MKLLRAHLVIDAESNRRALIGDFADIDALREHVGDAHDPGAVIVEPIEFNEDTTNPVYENAGEEQALSEYGKKK